MHIPNKVGYFLLSNSSDFENADSAAEKSSMYMQLHAKPRYACDRTSPLVIGEFLLALNYRNKSSCTV